MKKLQALIMKGFGEMKYNIVKSAETWAKIQALGTYEQPFKNGEMWSFNNQLWYLSHIELPISELHEITEFLH